MIDTETGQVLSRVDNEIALPVLQFNKMGPDNNFDTIYELEKMSVYNLSHMTVINTRKIPVEIKNTHRKFWEMPVLKEASNESRRSS
jgi:hypothetical protein